MNDNFEFRVPITETKPARDPKRRGIPVGVFLSIVALILVVSILLTSFFVSAYQKKRYTQQLLDQQEQLDRQTALIKELQNNSELPISGGTFSELEVLDAVFRRYSYYADTFDEEELLTAVLKAYAEATGDKYAEYYTEEEYEELMADSAGDHEGIGVTVVNSSVVAGGSDQPVFQIVQVNPGAPAEKAGLKTGDCLYAVEVDGVFKTITDLGGYRLALTYIRGEPGTTVTVRYYRPNGTGGYSDMTSTMTRAHFESIAVSLSYVNGDPKTAIIRISEFDLTAPSQFKSCVETAKAAGATRFVMDLRGNPGGDLQSIKAIMTYFLPVGSVILRATDRTGATNMAYYSEVIFNVGSYASCNVSANEIGMYADLNMVVLCDGNTASAAEVFVANMQDYDIAPVIGTQTFGKGIMQTFLPMSYFGRYTGYAKLTTYAICTKRPESYHDVGITPDYVKELSEEAKSYNLYLLPQEKDDQLIEALKHFKQ